MANALLSRIPRPSVALEQIAPRPPQLRHLCSGPPRAGATTAPRKISRRGWWPSTRGASRIGKQTLCRAEAGDETSSEEKYSTVTVTLKKPLGLVLAERKGGGVFVEEIIAGGHADMSGEVRVGDIISACSAVVLKSGSEGKYESEGYGQRPYDDWDRIWFEAEGQDFKTVMSAIGSNNERWGYNSVDLRLKRRLESE